MRLRKAPDRTQAANGRGGGIVGGVSLALEGARRQRLAARDCEQTDTISWGQWVRWESRRQDCRRGKELNRGV
jgi:hypothetical protein